MAESLSNLQQSVEYQVQGDLAPGERLLWAGRPRGGIKFTGTDAYRVPIGFLFTGFSIFFEIIAISMGGGLASAVWGIPARPP